MAWSEIKPALVSLISSLAFDDEGSFEAQWAGRARKATSPIYRADLFLTVTTVVGLGQDELRRSKDEAGNVTETVVGQRRFVLRVEALALDDTDRASAAHLIERVRTRLRRSRSVEALSAVDVGCSFVGPSFDTTFMQEGRARPRTTLDVTLLTSVSDDDPIFAGFIARVEWSSRIQDTSGVELPVPPNVTHEVTPPVV